MTRPDNARHPRKAISSLASGTASAVERRRALRHLAAGCAECADSFDRARHPPAATPAQLAAVLDRVATGAPELAQSVSAARRRAVGLADRLVELDEEHTRLRLANTDPADRRAMVHELLERAREHRSDDPHETLRLARLATAAAGLAGLDELRAEALAELGNAERIAGDLRAAEATLGEAWELVAEHGTDPLARADLLSLRASLARDQRRFEEGLRLARRALNLYRLQDDESMMAKTLIQLGVLYRDLDEPELGIAALADAIELLQSDADPRLLMIAIHDLACLYARSGHPDQALHYTHQARVLLDAIGTPLDWLRFEWVSARAWMELGRCRAAAAIFKRLRESYLEEDLPYEAALVSLELAVAEAELGNRRALHGLVEETAELFAHLGVDRETTATLALLAQARAAEAAELAGRLAARLRQLPPGMRAARLD